MTLVEFLRARLDEDEAAAHATGGAAWEASVPNMIHVSATSQREERGLRHQGYVASTEHAEHQRHIARHDPARVLREVDAKRRMLEWHDRAHPHDGDPCTTQRLLVLPYADHPDYREEWKP